MSYTEREPRKAVELEILMKDFSFIKTAEESSLNLSQGGAFIKMDEPYPTGTLVKFKLKTPDDKVIDGVGKVAWFRKANSDSTVPSGVGIKFLKMSDEGRAALEKILETAEVIVPEPEILPAEEKAAAEKTSDAPPEAKISTAPASRKSVPPEMSGEPTSAPAEPKEAEAEERVSTDPDTNRAYNAKKTQTISFPPKGLVRTEAEEKAPSTESADESSAGGRDSEAAEKEASAAVAASAAVESPSVAVEAATDTNKVTPSEGGSGGTKLLVAAIVVIAAAIGLWAVFGMDGGAGAPPTEPSEPTAEPPQAAPSPADEAPEPPPTPPPTPMQAAPVNEAPAAAADEGSAPQAEPATAAAAEPAPVSEEMTAVEVVVDPPEATLTVNDVAQTGSSPFQVQLPKDKESTLIARAAGFITQTVPFTPSEETPSAHINLLPARIKFDISSTPPGARILIDGKFNGTTPYTFLRKKYKPDYHWKIEKKGYESVEGTIPEDQWVEEGRYYIFTLNAELPRKKSNADTDADP